MPLARDDRPRLASKARLVRDRNTGKYVLLYPERGLALNPVAAAVAQRLDGTRTVAAIAEDVARAFVDADAVEVERDAIVFLEALEERGLIDLASAPLPVPVHERAGNDGQHPYTLIAELTYRCPLRCPYCSNPTELSHASTELSTEDWCRILGEAADLGVMQVHLTGGEPLARRDLETIARRARGVGLYVNLITSGVPLSRERFDALVAAGIDHLQLSVQDADPAEADRIAGYPSFAHKLEVASWVKAARLPLTVNVVLHRANLARVPEIIALAERLGADRLELANTQYLGWALANRDALLPSQEQLDRAFAVAAEARARLLGRMEMVFVTPDYWSEHPRACMDGWARRYVHVSPDGLVLPCHAAHTLPGLTFESARDRSLGDIWNSSPGLDAFRGDAWMKEPCTSCPRKGIDFGGCRCQAFRLTGDAAATDPACSLAPAHGLIEAARLAASRAEPRYLYRSAPVTMGPQAAPNPAPPSAATITRASGTPPPSAPARGT